ncbi:hypothetical protein KY289_026862 [Solanum tuberosum]|nr:hypothetical protein KY289_026862 [Solanum tuberosum]
MAPLKVKENLTGPSVRLSSWTDQQNCCQWFGVTYENKTGNVIKILQHFRNLDLSMNKSGGIKVPKFIGRLKELSELHDEFAKLNLFEYLDLSSIYGINGTLKRSLGKLCNLKTLILSYNNILKT